jgi:lipoprotein-anchoring transpeptidase ErfK/SrfK
MTLAILTIGVVIVNALVATHFTDAKASVIDSNLRKTVAALSQKISLASTPVPQVSCDYTAPEKTEYNAAVVEVRKKLQVDAGEIFRVKVFMRNDGNTPWFSGDSGCTSGPVVNLGTDMERDHASIFYSPEIKKDDNNWIGSNRVGMDQMRIDPGYTASFTFWAKAGRDADVYREFMTPVVEGITWIDSSNFSFDTMVGDTGSNPTTLREQLMFSGESGSVLSLNPDGEKLISVDLSEQKMVVTLDGKLVKSFTVSTGATKTPTPVGEYKISLKQEVRIGSAAPHYVMPKFMMFRNGGYGIHALPSLSRKGGDLFWTEARSHIGRPVSHGCIRVLPEDAEFVFAFADIGTKVAVQR